MEYNKIIAVTGLPGLYELLSSKADGAIVRSLDDKSTRFVSSRIHNFSHLESIEVYTVRDNVNLVDILKAMEGSSEKLPDEKDAAGLKTYFTKVYPDLDFERVYSSDLKKMVKWFAVLKNNQIEIKLSEPVQEEEEEAAPARAAKPAQPAAPARSKAKAEPAPEHKEGPGSKKPAAHEAAASSSAKPSAAAKSKAKAGAVKEEPKAKKSATAKAASEKAAPKKKAEEKTSKPAKKAAPKKKK
jgi:hypothetical protein